MAVKYTNEEEYKFNLHEAEIKYQQELNQKEDKIDIMNNTINTQALEI